LEVVAYFDFLSFKSARENVWCCILTVFYDVNVMSFIRDV